MTRPLASVDEFRDWPGVTIAEDRQSSAQFLLQAASAVVRDYTGRTWLGEGDLLDPALPETAKFVVIEVAAAVWNNPQNASSKTTGPFAIQLPDGGLTLTDNQKERLQFWVATEERPKLWALGTTRGIHDLVCPSVFLDTIYADDGRAGDPIPWESLP